MMELSSFLICSYLLLCIFILIQSSAEFYQNNEEFKPYDPVLTEEEIYESDGSDRYDQEQPSKYYEEKEIYEPDGNERYNQELPSKSYGEEKAYKIRGFRQNGNIDFLPPFIYFETFTKVKLVQFYDNLI